MSVEAMGRVWKLEMDANWRLVLLAMADHADHEGRNIFPSVGLIAWKTGYSKRSVQRIVKELVAEGLLKVQSARAGATTIYSIPLNAGREKGNYVPQYDLEHAERQRFIDSVIEEIGCVCQYCTREGTDQYDPDGNPWEVDRIRPASQGGRYEYGNMALSCRRCNRQKSGAYVRPSIMTRAILAPVDDPCQVGTPAKSAPQNVADGTPTRATAMAPKPSLEPSSNHHVMAAKTADELFEEFAAEYPKRLGDLCKAKARRDHLRKTFGKPALACQVIDGARRYREFVTATGDVGTRLVCQMTTWLNQERWTEKYEIPDPNAPNQAIPSHTKPLAGVDYVLHCPDGSDVARYYEPDRSRPFDAIGWFEKRRLPVDRSWEKYCEQQAEAA